MVISVSFPRVNEFVTDLLGVLDVTTKLFPVCWISVMGLMSLAALMISSDKAGEVERDRDTQRDVVEQKMENVKDPDWIRSKNCLLEHRSSPFPQYTSGDTFK